MNRKFLHIAMYRVMACLYDEKPTKKLLQFFTDSNPDLYKERTTADPAIQANFNDSMEKTL